MATHPSSLKRHRQSEKRCKRNRAVKSTLKTLVKKVGSSANKKEGLENLKLTVSRFHKAAQKGVLHRKTVNRKISRLTQFVNNLS